MRRVLHRSYLSRRFLWQTVRHNHLTVIVNRLTIRVLPPLIRGGTWDTFFEVARDNMMPQSHTGRHSY